MNFLLNPWLIFLVWPALWCARLRLVPLYFERTLALGYYPPEADSIAIPIVGNIIATYVGAPLFAIVLWFFLRRSTSQRRRWFAWCGERWGWSLLWTILFGVPVLLSAGL